MHDEAGSSNEKGPDTGVRRDRTGHGTLLTQETLFRVLEKMPIGVYIADPSGRIVYGNRAGRRIWAGLKYVTADEFSEYKAWWADSGRPISSDEWALSRAIKKGETSTDEEIEIECFDGTRKTILNSALPLYDEDGKICGGFATNEDITSQKAASAELKRLANFPSENPNPVLQMARNGLILYANAASANLLKDLGYIEDRPLNETWAKLASNALQTKKPVITEMRIGDRYFSLSFAPIAGDCVNVYALDITERKEAEQKLLSERDVLQTVMNGAKNFHLVYLDRDFNFVLVNQVYAKTCGYKPEEMIGKNYFGLYPDPENEAIFAEARDTGETFEIQNKPFDFPNQPDRGTTYWDWTLTPVKNNAGYVTGLVFSLFETTERKRAEKALRKSEQAFRSLFDDHAAVKLIIDPDTGRIIAANHAAEAFYGWSCDTLMQMNIGQINTKSPDEIKKSMEDAIRQKKIQFDFQHRLADGSIRNVKVFSSGVEMNERRYLHSIVHDITEQKKVEKEMEELQIQNWRLKKSESLSRMAGAIAHHFNNHMMGIMGNLELGLELLKQNESPEKNMVEAMKVAKNAAAVSGLMLTYLGQNISGKTPMDLGKVCRMSMPLLKAAFPANITLEADFPSHGPIVYGNASQVQQLVTNLVANAVESYDEKGTVRVVVKTVHAGEIPRQYRLPADWTPDRDEYACVEVADSGCGIEEQNIEKIFDPFFSTKSGGRGLDLAVVLGIVKANNGAITVESKKGEGSIFRFFAPVMTDPIERQPD